jgi:hypothetical protein
MAYPCREGGFVTSWRREDFYCGNGDSHEAAIEDATQSILQVDCADYEGGADVVFKPLGIKAKITEVLTKDDVQRPFGRRYEVGFFNDNGLLEAVKYCRQSELERWLDMADTQWVHVPAPFVDTNGSAVSTGNQEVDSETRRTVDCTRRGVRDSLQGMGAWHFLKGQCSGLGEAGRKRAVARQTSHRFLSRSWITRRSRSEPDDYNHAFRRLREPDAFRFLFDSQ